LLGQVRVVVHEGDEGLADKDREPEDDVAQIIMTLDGFRDDDERDLAENAEESPELDLMEWHREDILMEEGRDEEGGQGSRVFPHVPIDDGLIDVPLDPIMDREVPRAPIISQRFGIPPIRIEAAISESSCLSDHVQVDLEERVEAQEPDIEIRDSGLEEPLNDADVVALLNVDDGVLDGWIDILMGNDISQDTEEEE